MSLALWTLGQLLGLALCVLAVLLIGVVLDALHAFHAAGMARVHHHNLEKRT